MKKIIHGKTYNTDTAQVLAHRVCGAYGDPAGYEEYLCRTPRGLLFVRGLGGETSPYPREALRPVTEAEAAAFEET